MIKLIEAVGGLIGMSIKILVGVALIVFFAGLVKFIFHVSGDEKAVDEGKRVMKWGILALFVMLSVWGIVGFFQRGLGLPDTTRPELPDDTPATSPFNLLENA